MFQEEGFDFRKTAIRHLVSAELRRFPLDPKIVHPLDVCCRLDISLENQQKAGYVCKPLINCVCSVILEQLKKKEIGFSWCTVASSGAEPRQCEESPGNEKAGSERKSNCPETGTSHGRDSVQKTRFCFRSPSVVEQNEKQKPEMDLADLPKTASLEQVTTFDARAQTTRRV